MFIYFQYMRFKIRVHIYEMASGGSTFIEDDRARFTKDKDGQIYLKLQKNSKALLTPLDSRFIYVFKGLFMRKAIVFAKTNEGQLVPQWTPQDMSSTWHNPPFTTPEKFMDMDVFNSAIQNEILIKLKNKKENLTIQMLPWIVLLVIVIVSGLLFKYAVDKNAVVATTINAAASKIDLAVDKLVPFLEKIAGSRGNAPP